MPRDNILVGNTPMIRINYKYKNKQNYIYTKLEYYNLTGSIKDRVAYYIIKNAKKRGVLKDGMPIIEATSGNTGIALSALGSYYNHPVYIYMPAWSSQERIKIMEAYGAKVKIFSKEEGGFKRCLSEAEKVATESNGFLADQFGNIDNFLAHYETTAEEILKQIPEEIGGFVSGVGTGGTLMGIGKKLKENFKKLSIIAVEPDKMPMISKGEMIAQHKIEGIGDDFVPDLLDKSAIDKITLIDDEDAINMSRKLSKELGLGVGISSGANFIGAVVNSEDDSKPIVTVFADDNKKYLSTDLLKPIDENEKFISNKIELIDFQFIF